MASTITKKKAPGIALVGSETLLGREIQDVLQERKTGAVVHTFSASAEGNFGEDEGEPIYVEPLGMESIRDAQTVIHAGSGVGAAKAYDLAAAAGGRLKLIDCTGQLEDRPEARLISASAIRSELAGSWLFVVPHPAASALVLVLSRLAKKAKVQQAIAHVFEPASERGKSGISELHQQTMSLLTFKPLDKAIYDAQLSFNLLPQFGENAPLKLSSVERRIERHVASLLSREPNRASIPIPSLRVLQVPVFHGYSISLWVEFESAVAPKAIEEALASAQIEVRGQKDEVPSNVGATGQSGLIAGDIRTDANNPRAAWISVAGDNLRLTADFAADLIRESQAGEA